MKKNLLFTISGFLNIMWGVAHLFPTSRVVQSFGPISEDNRRVILMEWINEGLTLIFIGFMIIAVTFLQNNDGKVKRVVYLLSSIMLLAMAVLSFFTGFKIDFIAFKLCPFIFMVSALFLLIGLIKEGITGPEQTI